MCCDLPWLVSADAPVSLDGHLPTVLARCSTGHSPTQLLPQTLAQLDCDVRVLLYVQLLVMGQEALEPAQVTGDMGVDSCSGTPGSGKTELNNLHI